MKFNYEYFKKQNKKTSLWDAVVLILMFQMKTESWYDAHCLTKWIMHICMIFFFTMWNNSNPDTVLWFKGGDGNVLFMGMERATNVMDTDSVSFDLSLSPCICFLDDSPVDFLLNIKCPVHSGTPRNFSWRCIENRGVAHQNLKP